MFKNPIKAIKSVWLYLIGIGLGIVFSAFVITFMLDKYTLQTTFLFIGLILGGVPMLYSKLDKKITKSSLVTFIITFLIVGIIPFLGTSGNVSSFNFINLFMVGMIAAGTMIIPGVSGSMVLMTLGYYEGVMDIIKTFIVSLTTFNMDGIVSGIFKLLPFGIGVLIGIILIAKLIKFLFAKYKKIVSYGILGLVVASPIAILKSMGYAQINILTLTISFVTFLIGFYISYMFGKKEN